MILRLTALSGLAAIGFSQVIIIYVSYPLSILVVPYPLSLIPYLLFLYLIERVSTTNRVRQTRQEGSHTLAGNAQ